MAPANKPPPSQAVGRPKNARPPVVPVIPLPLVQKQQQQRQRKQQRQEEEEKRKEQEQEKLREQLQQQKQQQQQRKQELHHKQQILQAEKHVECEEPTQEQTPPLSGVAPEADDTPAPLPVSAELPSSPPLSSTPQTTHETVTSTSASSPVSKTPQSSAAAVTAPAIVSTTAEPASSSAVNQVVSSRPAAASIPSAPPSAGLLPDFVFPPHARSGSTGRHRGGHPSRAAFSPPLHPPFHHHQGHPSNGSITFGAFHDSNNTSPAPNARGPFAPPPGLVGGPQFIPYAPPTMNDWPGPPPAMNGYTPTSGSFHGSSQSPDHMADGTVQPGPFPLPNQNGNVAPGNEPINALVSPPFIPLHGPLPAPAHIPHYRLDFGRTHHLQELVRHSLDNQQNVDCRLIIHFLGAQHQISAGSTSQSEQSAPLVVPGNRVVLSQSYTVGQLIQHAFANPYPGLFNVQIPDFHIDIDDPYVSREAAMQALRSLYGVPLDMAGSIDQALANFTAGFLFMLDHVESATIDQVSQAQAIRWNTVEKVLAYCLNGAFIPNTEDAGHAADCDPYGLPCAQAEFRYGRGTASPNIRRLLRMALDFIVQQFPATFVFDAGSLDSVASGPSKLSRFPASIAAGPPNNVNGNGMLLNGHAGHSASAGSVSLPSKRGSRPSRIMFGDLTPSSAVNGASAINGASVNANSIAAVLSRVLVNLPCGYLCYILSAIGQRGPSTDAPKEEIVRIAMAVVAERESRRLQAADDIRAGRLIPNEREAILQRLQNPVPPLDRNYQFGSWDVLGWKEDFNYGREQIQRTWQPTL